MMKLLYPREMLEQIFNEGALHLELNERDTIFTLVDTVFFSSLMLEEGEPVRVAVVYDQGGASTLANVTDSEHGAWGEEGPPTAWDVTRIQQRQFDPQFLAKLSRGLKYGTHLIVVGGSGRELWIDGIARRATQTNGGEVIRIAAPRPGVIVVELEDQELLRFDAGQRTAPTIDVLGSEGPVRAAVAAITGPIGPERHYSSVEWAVMRLLREMRSTSSGAILAMLSKAPDEELLAEVRYRRTEPHVLADRIKSDRDKTTAWINAVSFIPKGIGIEEARKSVMKGIAERDTAREALEAAITDVAHLSAIDGAVLVGPHLEIYGAGYIISGRQGINVMKALDAGMGMLEPLPSRNGARHNAAFSFAYDHPGGVAFVVSEDGPVSCALRVGDNVIVWSVRVSET